MVTANKTLKMSTMIHIYWALCGQQALYTTSAEACKPAVSSRRCAKHLICILSLIAQNSSRNWVLVLFLFYTWKDWGSEGTVDLSKVIHLVGSKVGVQDEPAWLPNFQALHLTPAGHLTYFLPRCQCAQAPSVQAWAVRSQKGHAQSSRKQREAHDSCTKVLLATDPGNLLSHGLTSISALSLPAK